MDRFSRMIEHPALAAESQTRFLHSLYKKLLVEASSSVFMDYMVTSHTASLDSLLLLTDVTYEFARSAWYEFLYRNYVGQFISSSKLLNYLVGI